MSNASSSSRRDFLKASGMVVMAGAAGYFGFDQLVRAAEVAQQSGAASSAGADYDRQKPTLVTIFLRGGADTFNAFVPYADPKYYEYRPSIAIPFKGEKKSICPQLMQTGIEVRQIGRRHHFSYRDTEITDAVLSVAGERTSPG